MYTSGFLCALGLFAVLQVPGAWGAQPGVPTQFHPGDQNTIVEKHNDLRAHVHPSASNMLEMTWLDSAADHAQYWANECLEEHSEPLLRKLDDGTICGENLFMSTHETNWTTVIQSWYNEVKHWEYGKGAVAPKAVGHFTQLVWYKSHQIGCAVSNCKDSRFKYFYVCHYCPQGNYQLEKPYSTGEVCSECPKHCSKNRLCNNPCPFTDHYTNCYYFKGYCEWPFLHRACPATCKCEDQIK